MLILIKQMIQALHPRQIGKLWKSFSIFIMAFGRGLQLVIVSTSNQMHRDHPHMGSEILLKTDHQYLKDDYDLLPSCSVSEMWIKTHKETQ